MLFKLLQLNKVDRDMEYKLVTRFRDLDLDNRGSLDIGVELPSAEQVRSMQARFVSGDTGGATNLIELWEKVRAEEMTVDVSTGPRAPATRGRFSECHDFSWSAQLYTDASTHTARVSIKFVAAYFMVGGVALWLNDFNVMNSFYLVSETLTTVGLGDISPQAQGTRAAAIFMIPGGLVIVTFGIAYSIQKGLIIDTSKEKPESHPIRDWLNTATTGRLLKTLMFFIVILTVGALAFMSKNNYSDCETVIDAYFFAVVVSTTVGYGHKIVPLTFEAKLFLSIYYFASTIAMSKVLGEIADIITSRRVNHIQKKIYDSVTWVHRSDLDLDGQVWFPFLQLPRDFLFCFDARPASFYFRASCLFIVLDGR